MTESGSERWQGNGAARVALIGLGGAADRILLPAFDALPNVVEVVAGCDVDGPTRERAAIRWKLPRTYATPEEMLERERPEVAVVATPPLTHRELCLLAIQ